jgi:CheY-like chemotaxis protein
VDAASAMRECNAHSNEILLSTAIDDSGRVVVTIADTGPGIAPEMLSRLFDPSFSTKVTAEGPVLGWSSCRRIVADLGGTIDVVSELGKGSIVRLVLLPAAQPSPSASRDVEPSVTSRRRRILVVNDDPGCGFALERARGRSHEIVVETSGASAIERLREGEQFDLILSDVMMPQMTGIDLHAALLRSNPDEVRRMVFISGGAFAPDVRALLENMTNPALDESLDQRQLREFASEWMAATLDRPRNVAR